MSRDSSERAAAFAASAQAAIEDTHNDCGSNEKTTLRRSQACQALLSVLPPSRDIQLLLDATCQWWDTARAMFPEIHIDETHQSLAQHIFWALAQSNPSIVAMAVLCVAICALQLQPGADNALLNSCLPPKQLLEQVMHLVDRLVIADDDFAGSGQGVELMLFQAKTYVNCGQPRRGWLILRRAISMAQLIGLHPRSKMQCGDFTRERREMSWWTLYEVDRYLSMLLGLPYAMSDEADVLLFGDDQTHPTLVYRRKLAVAAGHVIDRNRASASASLSATMEVDQRLDDHAKTMPTEWWDVGSAQAAGVARQIIFERLGTQMWHYQIKIFLHMPFMLESAKDCRYEYSRMACLEATRHMIRNYHGLRQDTGGTYYMCKIFDFQGFSAAVLLLLSLLGHRSPKVLDAPEQEAKDWRLIQDTIDVLRRASTTEDSNSVSVQGLHVLNTLTALRYEGTSAEARQKLKGTGKFVIPYFGTITISAGSMFSAGQARRQGSMMQTPSSSGFSPPAAMDPFLGSTQMDFGAPTRQSPILGDDEDATLAMPRIDFDWQGMDMGNMDLDQDWNWFLKED